MNTPPNYVIRPLTPEYVAFLEKMLYHAIYVTPGHAPPGRDVVRRPEIARYVRAWGRAGDSGFVALDANSQQPIGAAWLRLFSDADKGFGYVDEDTPELSIAVLPGQRGRGVGTSLLTQLLQAAASQHHAVSLSVAPGNPALRLYQRLGFETLGASGVSLTMIKILTPDQQRG